MKGLEGWKYCGLSQERGRVEEIGEVVRMRYCGLGIRKGEEVKDSYDDERK